MAYRDYRKTHYHKPPPKLPRIRIERGPDGTLFVLDSVSGSYSSHLTRRDAERELARIQKPLEPRAKALPGKAWDATRGVWCDASDFYERYFVFPEDQADPEDRDPAEDPVQICRAWASELAQQSGISDAERKRMNTDEIIVAMGLAKLKEPRFSKPAIYLLHEWLRPQWSALERAGDMGAVIVNSVSFEKADLKARHLGISRREFFNRLRTGYATVTRAVFTQPNNARVRHLERGAQPDDDADNARLMNRADLFGFTVQKW